MKRFTTTLVIAFSILGLASLLAWQSANSQAAKPTEQKMMNDKMMEHCNAMKDMQEKLMSDMKAQDEALTTEVARMNAAPDNQKLTLLAAVVTRMVEQRASMNLRTESMHASMMSHMMEHNGQGMGNMSQCPMMMGMVGMDDTPAHLHNGHQEKKK